jgi:thiamine-phosphate pyrophosphorylase
VSPLHRILDANANRAREALRVLEDAARFALDNPALNAQIKTLRHALRAALTQPALDHALRLGARDAENDPGRDTKTPEELTRESLHGIAAAAAARLTEALRSLEESAKGLNADPRPFELLRYRAYEAEKKLLLLLPTGRAPQWRLCILISESLCSIHAGGWLAVARACIAAGADCIQLREKELDSRELLHRARALRSLTAHARCALIINDRPDIALLSNADGVHLGQSDLSVQDARRLVGFRLLIGISTTNMDQARAATRGGGAPQSGGADYCGLGPMFPTTTKDKPTIAGPPYLREYLADPLTSQRPHLAIGGITPENIHELVEAGCRGVAVSSAVCCASDPGRACRELLEALQSSI